MHYIVVNLFFEVQIHLNTEETFYRGIKNGSEENHQCLSRTKNYIHSQI